MSFIESLRDKAVKEIMDGDKVEEWSQKGISSALEKARELLPQGDDLEIQAARETANYALHRIEKHKGELAKLGKEGLRYSMALVSLGKYDDAALEAAMLEARTAGTWDQVSEAIDAVAETGNEKKRELDQAIESFKKIFKDIGTAAARAALPFLLAL